MAVVTAKEYFDNLFRIQDENPPSLALLLPSSERTYHIDLNTRTVEAPEYLSVEQDHKSEVIYFTVNRFFDYMDLAETICIIKYINAKKESYYYSVPFYDIVTPNQNRNLIVQDDNGNNIGGQDAELMLLPWVIDGQVAKASGEVKYSFNFYKMDADGIRMVYSLSTIPAKSKILHGLNEYVTDANVDGKQEFKPDGYEWDANQFTQLMNAINENNAKWQAGLQWLRAE